MKSRCFLCRAFLVLLFIWFTAISSALAQSTAFSYQGKLSTSGNPATGDYDMQFKLFDALSDGNQIGATITNPAIAVENGVFAVQLDFGAGAFDGSPRFLEICVRPANDPNPYTVLSPRQAFSSIPYAMHSVNASAADGLSAACTGCIINTQIETVDGTKITGEIPTASVPEGSGNYIQNAAAALKAGKTSIQQDAGFNISGDGVMGTLAIGTTPPTDGTKLDVSGGPIRLTQSNNRVIQFGTPNTETGMTIKYNLPTISRADVRFDGTTLKLVAVDGNLVPPNQNGIAITTSGKVGIGTITPTAGYLLDVNGRALINTTGTQPTSPTTGALHVEDPGIAIYASAPDPLGYAGFFNGNIRVVRDVIASGLIQASDVYAPGLYGTLYGGSVYVSVISPAGTIPACYAESGRLAYCSSSLRYKKDFQPFADGLNFINQLRPIAFKWKSNGTPDIGFGAEDVEKINPLFVTYNQKGEIEGVKYDRLSVLFVNAFKEQQEQIRQQQRLIEQQQRQLDALTKLVCQQNPQADICK